MRPRCGAIAEGFVNPIIPIPVWFGGSAAMVRSNGAVRPSSSAKCWPANRLHAKSPLLETGVCAMVPLSLDISITAVGSCVPAGFAGPDRERTADLPAEMCYQSSRSVVLPINPAAQGPNYLPLVGRSDGEAVRVGELFRLSALQGDIRR